jgi:hypothetical protein
MRLGRREEERNLLTAWKHGQAEESEISQGHHTRKRKIQGTHSDCQRVVENAIGGVRYFADSLYSLGMLLTESGRFSEFTGTRVSEIKVKSDLKKE